MDSRFATAIAGILVSVVISVAVYWVTGSLLVFLVVPFVPFLLRGRDREAQTSVGDQTTALECPVCGFRTREAEFEYCPHDGTRLEREQ